MRFLEVFEAGELLVEVLSQVQNFLRHVKNLVLAHLAYIYKPGDYLRIDQLFLLELLANLQGNVNCTDGKQ